MIGIHTHTHTQECTHAYLNVKGRFQGAGEHTEREMKTVELRTTKNDFKIVIPFHIPTSSA